MSHRSLIVLLLLAAAPAVLAEDWESTIAPHRPGPFPPPQPLRMQYSFGWNDLTAATAEFRVTRGNGRLHLEGTGATTGMPRTLWRFDAKHSATTDEQTLLPLHVHETETQRGKTWETDLNYTAEDVTSVRHERHDGATKSKTRRFKFPNAMSLSSSLLYLRSQPLAEGEVHRLVVYPSTSAYLSTATVVGREQVQVPAGSFPAIKCRLQLKKINKDRTLKAHKKFKHATVWISDDAHRLVLRIEAQVFIGTVFAELQSVQFETAPSSAHLPATRR